MLDQFREWLNKSEKQKEYNRLTYLMWLSKGEEEAWDYLEQRNMLERLWYHDYRKLCK